MYILKSIRNMSWNQLITLEWTVSYNIFHSSSAFEVKSTSAYERILIDLDLFKITAYKVNFQFAKEFYLFNKFSLCIKDKTEMVLRENGLLCCWCYLCKIAFCFQFTINVYINKTNIHQHSLPITLSKSRLSTRLF